MHLRISQKTALLFALVATAAAGACGGDGDGGTGPGPTIAITVSPTTLSVMQGASGTVTVTLARGGGYSGPVTIAVDGAPGGVTATAAPASIPGGSTSSVITVAAAAGAAPGSYTMTVRATGQGVSASTASVALTVTAAPAQGYTLAVSPAAVSVQQGASGSTTVTLTRTGGFSGSVALTTTGLPAGVTATFDPQSTTGNTSTLTLSASAGAATGQATVTIHGAAPPLAGQTATLALTITAAPSGSGNTTWEFCRAADMPLWLAVQDGNGAWTRVVPNGTKFQFDIASATGGVAFVTATTEETILSASRSSTAGPLVPRVARELRARAHQAAVASRGMASLSVVDGFSLTIIYGSQQELDLQGTSQCVPGAGKTVNGTIAGLTMEHTASITLGDAVAEVVPPQSTFQLAGVPDGALDLIATRGTFDLLTFSFPVDRMIIRRGLDQPNNSTLSVLDFDAAEAFAPAEATIAVANLGTDVALVTTTYFTASGTSGALLFNGFGSGSGPFTYYGVPGDRQIAGDLHFALAFALPDDEDADDARIAGLFFGEPTDRTVTLNAVLPDQTVTVASTAPYVRLRAHGSVTAAYNKFVEVVWDQLSSSVPRSASVGASSTYLANATEYDLTIPDFSGTAGWNNAWAPRTGVETDWAVTAAGFSGIGLASPRPVEGATIQGALRMGTIIP